MTVEKINVSTFNWGPCVIKLNITEDCKKFLLDEGKKNKLDFTELETELKTKIG